MGIPDKHWNTSSLEFGEMLIDKNNVPIRLEMFNLISSIFNRKLRIGFQNIF